jgi:hypothetical protein
MDFKVSIHNLQRNNMQGITKIAKVWILQLLVNIY